MNIKKTKSKEFAKFLSFEAMLIWFRTSTLVCLSLSLSLVHEHNVLCKIKNRICKTCRKSANFFLQASYKYTMKQCFLLSFSFLDQVTFSSFADGSLRGWLATTSISLFFDNLPDLKWVENLYKIKEGHKRFVWTLVPYFFTSSFNPQYFII